MSLARINRIPNFISAASPKGLRRAMLLNNLKFQTEFKYFDIQKDGKKWIVWYYEEIEDDKALNEATREAAGV